MPTQIQSEIAKLSGPAQKLAQLISDISMRIFKVEWNYDIEWKVRRAMDNGSFPISNVKSESDPGEGNLTPDQVAQLGQLREELQDGWVHLDGLHLKRHSKQPPGFLRSVSAQEWRDTIGTEKYRLERYKVVD